MSLDVVKVAQHIAEMAQSLQEGQEEHRRRLEEALHTFQGGPATLRRLRQTLDHIAAQQRQGRRLVTWLPAGLVDGLRGSFPPPEAPAAYAIVATDGSQIDLDRHAPVSAYLVNIGRAVFRYGPGSSAHLSSQPSLHYKEEELFLRDPQNASRQLRFDGTVLRLQRSLRELATLGELVASLPPELPTLALMDGTLIFWDILSKEALAGWFLGEVRQALDQLHALSRQRPLMVAGYISHSGATDVAHALRIAVCPFQETIDCDRYCRQQIQCEQVGGILDRELFARELAPGHRSPLYRSLSKVLEQYGEHEICFFYLKVGEEIARVELPRWVAQDPELVALTHCLILDQCRRGQGYPAALQEAHEQAVVTEADRKLFWQMVEATVFPQRPPPPPSGKAWSKRLRSL